MATAVPTTNVNWGSLQTVFGGSNPISISEYYAGGAYVPSGEQSPVDPSPVPSTGAIRIGEFRGCINNPVVQNISVRSAMSNYPTGTTTCQITFLSDGTISNTGSGGGAIHTGTGNTYWVTPNGGSNNYSSTYYFVITSIPSPSSTGTYAPTITGTFSGNVNATAGPDEVVSVTFDGNIVRVSDNTVMSTFALTLSLDNT